MNKIIKYFGIKAPDESQIFDNSNTCLFGPFSEPTAKDKKVIEDEDIMNVPSETQDESKSHCD